ncbi:MAG: ribosome silencing factor [Planctomycetes bacterium]|nr:ribosome silencing factor [Planctomycetota bacterium]
MRVILEGMNNPDMQQFAIEIARIASDNKSEDVTTMDLRGLSQVTDYVVICTGTSDRQIRSVADRMLEYGQEVGEQVYSVSGYTNATWILVDFIDVVVHIFAKQYREYYDLELLWGDAPKVHWARSESA